MIRLRQIEDAPIVQNLHPPEKRYPIKGAEIANVKYPNIGIIGPHGSGKTNLQWNIIKAILGKESCIFIFSPTANNDKIALSEISKIKNWEERVEINPGIFTPEGESILDAVIEQYDETPLIEKGKLVNKAIIVLDDLPTQLKKKNVQSLFKLIRHRCCACIACFHDMMDISKDSRPEIDIVMIFGGIAEERFKTFMEQWGGRKRKFNIDELYKIYSNPAIIRDEELDENGEEIHDFLYITKKGDIRRNFREVIENV